MQNNSNYKQYIRQVRVSEFGEEGQVKMTDSKILVVGAGALGCPALQYLAASGVGTLGVLDADEVDITNLHRQVLYTHADLGRPKALTAANRLKAMNPAISITPHQVHLHKGNALEIIKNYDLVVECSDNFPTKFLVNDACVMLGRPFIIGGAIQFSGQLSVYNYKGGPTYRCLIDEEPDPLEVPLCSEAGVIGMVPGIIGTLQALEALKVLTGVGQTLSGKLLHFDGITMQFSTFDISLNSKNLEITELTEYDFHCPAHILADKQIESQQFFTLLNSNQPIELLYFSDEPEEFRYKQFFAKPIPLYQLPNRVAKLSQANRIVLLCDYGIKSLSALRYLVTKHGFENVVNLKDGLKAFNTILNIG